MVKKIKDINYLKVEAIPKKKEKFDWLGIDNSKAETFFGYNKKEKAKKSAKEYYDSNKYDVYVYKYQYPNKIGIFTPADKIEIFNSKEQPISDLKAINRI